MVHADDRPLLGPYILTRRLPDCPLAERWLALHEMDQSSHVVYLFPTRHGNSEKRRFLTAVQHAAELEHAHILRIEQYSFDVGGRPWLVTPFTGDADGLLRIERLLRTKGGQMSPQEAERAIMQLLEAVDYAHERGHCHGPIRLDEVIVDRHGSVLIELYELARGLRGLLAAGNAELRRDEVRSVVEIAYTLITGLSAEEPLIPAGRLVRRLDREWDEWLDRGLDPTGGFDSAREAFDALPSMREGREIRRPRVSVRGVLDRFRSSIS